MKFKKSLILVFIIIFFTVIIYATATEFSLSINTPANNTNTTNNETDFNFVVSGTEAEYECDLFMNGSIINNKWESDSTIISGLTSAFIHPKTDVFYKDGTWYAIVVASNGIIRGFNWTGLTWQTDNAIKSGLATTPYETTITIFEKDSTWYAIIGYDAGGFVGYNWTGSAWQSDSAIISGLGDIGSNSKPHVFYKDGTWYLLAGETSAIYGFNWTGSTWQADSAIASGVTAAGTADIDVFEKDNIWYLMKATSNGVITGYYWNSSTWLVNTTVRIGIPNSGSWGGLTIYEKDSTWYFLRTDGSEVGFFGYNLTETLNDTATVIILNTEISDGLNQEWYINCTSNETSNVSGTFLINIDTTSPVINSNQTSNETPIYNDTINITVDISDATSTIAYCNFTLTNPNSIDVIDNENGSVSGNIWNSTNYNINVSGNWTVNITCADTFNNSIESIWIFRADLGTIASIPETKTFSQIAGESETFNLTLSHDGNNNNTIDFNITGDINITSNFTIIFEEDPTIVEESETQYILINITSNLGLTSGTYTGNITWNRTEDGTTGVIEITVYISSQVADIVLTPIIVAKSLYNTASTTQTYIVNNTGNYNATHCNMSVSDGISSYTVFNSSDFTINISEPVSVLMTITNPAIGIYTSNVVVTCIATATGGLDDDSSVLTVISSSAPITPGGGGGGVDLCSNGICDASESYESCPSDCYISPNMIMDITPSVYTIVTNNGRLIDRYFVLKNPNSIDIELNIKIMCIEDISCDWAYFYDDQLNRVKAITLTVPSGNIVSPGTIINYFYIDIPDNIDDGDFYFNVVGTQQTLGVTLPVKISVAESYGILYIITDLFTGLKLTQVNPLVLIGGSLLILFGFFGFLMISKGKTRQKR